MRRTLRPVGSPPVARLTACLVCLLASAAPLAATTTIHVAPTGDDKMEGSVSRPFRTIARAQQAVRERTAKGLTGDVCVVLTGGTYRPAKTLTFTAADGGTDKWPVVYMPALGESVTISGGIPITGWHKADGKLWTAKVPRVAEGNWHFRHLWVGGKRATRARTPNASPTGDVYDRTAYTHLTGVTRSKDGTQFRLQFPPGIVRAWKHVADVEVLTHGNWAVNRKKLAAADPATHTVTLAPPHAAAIPWNRPTRGRCCYLENAREMLDQPGEWYLDRTSGVLTYWPRDREDMTKADVVASKLTHLVEVRGTPEAPVRNLHFRGITFAHTTWPLPPGGYHGVQACHYLTAGRAKRDWLQVEPAIRFEAAQNCSVTDGRIAHAGGTGAYIARDCRDVAIERNHVFDISANGLCAAGPNDEKHTPKNVRLANNYVHATGAEYYGAVGIFVGFAEGTQVVHNLVHDAPYTGISVGWAWHDKPTACRKNLLAGNHVYDVMKKLADGGCIYTLGLQPGTVLRDNWLHKVHRSPFTHGGAPNNGIFIDQGSKGYLFERNLIYDCHGGPLRFNQCKREWHTWKDNVLGQAAGLPDDISGALLCTGKTALDTHHADELEPDTLTLETWFYFTGGRDAGARQWLVNKNDDEWISGHYGLLVWSNRAGAYMNIGGGAKNTVEAFSPTGSIHAGRWHHLAMTYDGKTLRVYLDGKPAAQATPGKPRTKGKLPLTIGARQDRMPGGGFHGLIDEVRLYSRPLSAAELAPRAAAGTPAKAHNLPDPKGLVRRWSFDDRKDPRPADRPKDQKALADQIRAAAGIEPKYRKQVMGQTPTRSK